MYKKNIISKKLLLYLDLKSNDKYPSSLLKRFRKKVSTRINLISHWLRFAIKAPQSMLLEPTDILFIHPVKVSKKLNRKRNLIQKLKDKGLSVTEIECLSSSEISQTGKSWGKSKESTYFRMFDLYAKYLIYKYSPKIILTEKNDDLCSPFFKKHINGKVIHLAHSVLTSESHKYSMIDYHYYFLYGQSSIDYLESLRLKFGNCLFIEAGSYLFDVDFELKATTNLSSVLLLGMGPALEKKQEYINYYRILEDWAKQTPSITLEVRLHPRSNGDFWLNAQKEIDNVNVRPREENFMLSCQSSFMCITTYTNAVIDAALLKRPSLLICNDSTEDFLKLEKFFHKRVNDIKSLMNAIEFYQTHYQILVDQAKDFSNFHISQGHNSTNFISESIINICNDSVIKERTILKGNI